MPVLFQAIAKCDLCAATIPLTLSLARGQQRIPVISVENNVPEGWTDPFDDNVYCPEHNHYYQERKREEGERAERARKRKERNERKKKEKE